MLRLALKGSAQSHKQLLDDTKIKQGSNDDEPPLCLGVEYFLDYFRQKYVKGADNVFLLRFFKVMRANRGSKDYMAWFSHLELIKRQAKEAWDLLGMERRPTKESTRYIEWVRNRNKEEQDKAFLQTYKNQLDADEARGRQAPRVEEVKAERLEQRDDSTYELFKAEYTKDWSSKYLFQENLMAI